jgi:hypothetical protein
MAMVLGRTYRAVKEEWPYFIKRRNEKNLGIPIHVMDQYLGEHGFAVHRIKPTYTPTGEKRSPWPPPPTSDFRILEVRPHRGAKLGHMVIQLRDESILDPELEFPSTLDLYHSVKSITTLWPMSL